MLQETVLRIKDVDQLGSPIVICNEEHRFIIAEQLLQIGVADAQLILEPVGRNTAPAALVAALYTIAKNKNSTLLILPADHLIKNTNALVQLVKNGLASAENGLLVTFGVKPDHAETGYGYIKMGEEKSQGIFAVEKFVEKPNSQTAEEYLADGHYLWNSGMFLFNAKRYVEEVAEHQPNMLTSCQAALDKSTQDLGFIRLDKTAFENCPGNSIDYAVMEKTKQGAVIPFNEQWNDLGSWTALWDVHEKNSENNVLIGDVLAHDVKNSYIRSENKLVAAIGLENHIIVETADAVLVADKSKAQDVNQIVKQLKNNERSEAHSHRVVYRPWGNYQTLDTGERFQAKRIFVKPGARLSLQLHHKRAEHWIVVTGTATVTCGENTFELGENQSTYIPIKTKHRLENATADPLEIIEVQSGTYLGEDDIERFEDDYQRN